MIPQFIIISVLLFSIGLVGVLLRRDILIILMSTELMLNAINLLFVTFSRMHQQIDGQVFVFFIMTLAAAEVAVGLAIVVMVYRRLKTTDITKMGRMKG
ncbi:MAG: NADH-quinone oxidoreductase subunit NuoK [Candidatus Marinimicrobia bacterium]|nr:NADH-quinone oxidoreductase subunit NuoK [Candidatus Neomarinimicrobiota bacterium]